MKKIMIDIEKTVNGGIITTTHTPKPTGIIGVITPRQEPEKRTFENSKKMIEWIEKELERL